MHACKILSLSEEEGHVQGEGDSGKCVSTVFMILISAFLWMSSLVTAYSQLAIPENMHKCIHKQIPITTLSAFVAEYTPKKLLTIHSCKKHPQII